MKYAGMPYGMWLLFGRSFYKSTKTVLGFDTKTAKAVRKNAKSKYKEIIAKLPEFEKGDRFKMNIVNCALLAAFYLQMCTKPSLDKMTEFYSSAMMIKPMKWFCRLGGKGKFSEKDYEGMRRTEALRAADRNPYSWNMEFYPYKDSSGYEVRFTKCGICALLSELGIPEVTPAMCRLDYTMSEAGGASIFVREYTLATGGPYCDCGYKKKV